MAATKGKLIYKVYRALSYGLSPLLYLHLRWRVLRGLEHPFRWPERLGRPSHARPPGPLLWFHAVSLGSFSNTIISFFLQRNSEMNHNLSESMKCIDCSCVCLEWNVVSCSYAGEGLATIPIIKQCIQRRPDLVVLMTTTTYSAL